ncbi:MAG TPA: hypothetical protein VHR86_03055 [Armatimonadota bacterium]|nr:hypothetical protein [Armatimonadota bacterium]
MHKRNAATSGWTVLGRIFIGAIVGALLFTAIGKLIPHRYTSAAVLLFPGAKSSGGGTPAATDSTGGGGSSSDQPSLPLMEGVLSVPQLGTSPSTAALILNSRQTTVALIQKFKLNEEWHLPMEKAIEYFQEYYQCIEGPSGDLRIHYTDRTPERAQQMLTEAIKILTASIERFSEHPATKNVAYLHDNLKKAEANCDRIQKEIVRLQRMTGGTPPDSEIQTLSQLLADVQKELTTAQVEASVADSSLKVTSNVSTRIMRTAQSPVSSGSDKELISILYRDVAQRESDLALLREKYTDRRPEVVQARQALATARRGLEKEVARQVQSVQSGASPLTKDALITALTARARMAGLQQSAKRIQATLEMLPDALVKYNALTSDLKDERARVSLLRSEYLRAQLIVESRGPQFVMLDPPTRPRRPNGYELIYFTGAGAIAGALYVLLASLYGLIRRSMKEMRM